MADQKPLDQMTDLELAVSLLRERDMYSFIEDGDGMRWGEQFFKAAEARLEAHVKEIFTRIAANPAASHPAFAPLREALSPMKSAGRADGPAIYEAIRDVSMKDVEKSAAISADIAKKQQRLKDRAPRQRFKL